MKGEEMDRCKELIKEINFLREATYIEGKIKNEKLINLAGELGKLILEKRLDLSTTC